MQTNMEGAKNRTSGGGLQVGEIFRELGDLGELALGQLRNVVDEVFLVRVRLYLEELSA
jgi:hypothetical protein